MAAGSAEKRRPGRPREFDVDAALDRAVDLFWEFGYDGVDVERIARAAGVTKPSLYKAFGDKASLFLHALDRYGRTVGALPLGAFEDQADVVDAVGALFEAAVLAATQEGRPRGCLLACVAVTRAGHSEEIRAVLASGIATLTTVLERRFAGEVDQGRLSPGLSPRARSRTVVDLMQGLMVRARLGVERSALLREARDHVDVVFGLDPRHIRTTGITSSRGS